MMMYGPLVLAEMRAICAHHGTLFIADEVMTGWGRTGSLLAGAGRDRARSAVPV